MELEYLKSKGSVCHGLEKIADSCKMMAMEWNEDEALALMIQDKGKAKANINHYEVHKWTSSLWSPQMDEFSTKSLSGQIHY